MFFLRRPPKAPDWQTVKIRKGRCFALPYWYDYRVRKSLRLRHIIEKIGGEAAPPDNLDWWKLTGLSFDLWTNHRNSAMVSFRYNRAMEHVELGFYLHHDGDVIKPRHDGGEVFATVRPGQEFETHIELLPLSRVRLSIKTNTIHTYEKTYTIDTNKKTRVINPYACGTFPPTQDVIISRQLI